MGRPYNELPSCADILTDVVENYAEAAPFIPLIVKLRLSEDDDQGHVLEEAVCGQSSNTGLPWTCDRV